MNKENVKDKKISSKKSILVIVFSMLLILIAGTYAWYSWRSNETAMVLTVGDINRVRVTLSPYQINGSFGPTLTYQRNEYTQVTAVNNQDDTGKISLFYKINSIDSELVSSNFKYMILRSADGNTYSEYKNGDFSTAVSGEDLVILDAEEISGNTTYYYRVYLWIYGNEDNTGLEGKIFNGELRASILSSLVYTDSVLNGADPQLATSMIPVTIANDGTVSTANTTQEWYNYTDKEWANAVLVKSTGTNSRTYYEEKVENNEVVTIPEDDILAYYVWIPKYSYKMNGTEEAISISFNSTPTNYIDHPAFTFEDGQLGIWVGKFETSHSTLVSSTTKNNLGCTDENCANADELIIKPNVQSLRYNNVSNVFCAVRSMERSGNPFGLTASEVDTHMMKNSEWGAVAYLSHSVYGINQEIYINNSEGYYTGRSGGNIGGSVNALATQFGDSSLSTSTQYNTYGYYTWTGLPLDTSGNTGTITDSTLGTMASTTGNVTGVYDMSGGTNETVMGVFANASGNLWTGTSASYNSGFNGLYGTGSSVTEYLLGIDFPPSKYYEKYQATSGTTISEITACNGGECYGHAISETSGWYDDTAVLVNDSYPWVERGGSHSGADAGAFRFGRSPGDARSTYASRVVLVIVT